MRRLFPSRISASTVSSFILQPDSSLTASNSALNGPEPFRLPCSPAMLRCPARRIGSSYWTSAAPAGSLCLTSASMYFGEQLSHSHNSALLRGRGSPWSVFGGVSRTSVLEERACPLRKTQRVFKRFVSCGSLVPCCVGTSVRVSWLRYSPRAFLWAPASCARARRQLVTSDHTKRIRPTSSAGISWLANGQTGQGGCSRVTD